MYEMCMYLAWGSVGIEGGEWMGELGFGFTNPVRTGGMLDVCLCCGGVRGGGLVRGLRLGSGEVGWCYVCVRCESGLSV